MVAANHKGMSALKTQQETEERRKQLLNNAFGIDAKRKIVVIAGGKLS